MVDVPISFTSQERRFGGLPAVVLKNRFFEESPSQAGGAAMLARPGTRDIANVGTGPIRAFHSLPGLFDGALFFVSGKTAYRREVDGTTVALAGEVFGTGEVSMTGVAGAGFERLFIADGSLLQVYQGGTHASGVLTSPVQVIDGATIRIGDTYYRWTNTVGTGAGTLADPWDVLIGADLAESLDNMVKAINFTGVRGVTYSLNLGGQNVDVSAVSDATTMTVTAKVDLAAGNSIVIEVVSGGAAVTLAAVGVSGTGDRAMTSPDGINWSVQTSAADNDWHDMAHAPSLGLFAAVSITGTGNRVMTSPDGVTWTARTSASDNDWRGLAWSPTLSLFVAVAGTGTGNRVMTSPDGITWTSRTTPADNLWWAVVWSEEVGLFVATSITGTGNRVMTSPDGINWTIRTSAANNAWRGLAWSPSLSLFVAVAATGVGNRVMTSPDGINWTIRVSPVDNAWNSVVWSPERGLFVAVAFTGAGDQVMTSPDGINWTIRVSPVDNAWFSVVWSPALGLFVAVASTGTGNRAMTSPDGINWTVRTTPVDNNWDALALSQTQGLFWSGATLSGGGTHALSGVAVPDGLPPISVATIKSFIVVAIGGSDRFYFLQPGSLVIDPLDFATAESQPDDVVFATTVGDTVWFVGESSTEVWYPTGNLAAPFAPVGGRTFDQGAVEGTVVNVKGTVFLVGRDYVVYAIGGSPQRISNHGVEEMIRLALESE